RHGDDARLQAAEKRRRPVDSVEKRNQHALFAPDAEPPQRRAEARHTISELAVGVRAAYIYIGRLVGAAGIEIFLQDVGGEIVITWDCAHCSGFGRCRNRDCPSPLPAGHTPLVLPELCGPRTALAMRL